jgi:hypothetical protein
MFAAAAAGYYPRRGRPRNVSGAGLGVMGGASARGSMCNAWPRAARRGLGDGFGKGGVRVHDLFTITARSIPTRACSPSKAGNRVQHGATRTPLARPMLLSHSTQW